MPVIAKMTPNIASMTPVATAAYFAGVDSNPVTKGVQVSGIGGIALSWDALEFIQLGCPTGAIGLVSKAGRYGDTYAHKDIAFEFCGAISPVFKLYLIKEYQRLKGQESQIKFAYTSEAGLLNLALFHYTAKQWRDANPELSAKDLNPRNVAIIARLNSGPCQRRGTKRLPRREGAGE